jgi:hypothetical protein
MKKIPRATYKSPEEIEEEIERRQIALDLLPDGEVKSKVRAEIAQLRSYAEMKRLFA